jgi:hypothetical protein
MTASLPAMLVHQLGPGPAGFAVSLWPQIMASAREQLIPWVDQNAPDLAGSARLAFHDLDIVADEWRLAVRRSWRRLRVVLVGQTVQFGTAGDGGWTIWITSLLRGPVAGGSLVVVLRTTDRLGPEWLPRDVCVLKRSQFLSQPIDLAQIRDDLLSGTD